MAKAMHGIAVLYRCGCVHKDYPRLLLAKFNCTRNKFLRAVDLFAEFFIDGLAGRDEGVFVDLVDLHAGVLKLAQQFIVLLGARKSTRLNSSHYCASRIPYSA